jgi:hypothetical protein
MSGSCVHGQSHCLERGTFLEGGPFRVLDGVLFENSVRQLAAPSFDINAARLLWSFLDQWTSQDSVGTWRLRPALSNSSGLTPFGAVG